MNDFTLQSDIDLQQHHTRLAKSASKLAHELKAVEARMTPEAVLAAIRVEEQLNIVQTERKACAVEWVKRDDERKQRQLASLHAAADESTLVTTELVETVNEFLPKVARAFGGLGPQYSRIRELSARLEALERRLLNSRVRSSVQNTCKLSPAAIDKLLKVEIAKAFGSGVNAAYIGNFTPAMLDAMVIPTFTLSDFLEVEA